LIAVYIILGMLHENAFHPVIIISTLPLAGAGALATLLAWGFSLDMMEIIAIILLIGVVCTIVRPRCLTSGGDRGIASARRTCATLSRPSQNFQDWQDVC